MTPLIEPLAAAAHALPVLAAFDVFEHVHRWMHAAGYPVLFGLLLGCGLGLPLPEDVPLLLAGFFVAKGEMSLVPAAVTAWCGIIGGDCILYAIGRAFGTAITHVPVIGSHVNPQQIEKMHGQFERYGVWVVAVGRMFAGVRGAMVLVAGTIKFTFSHFIVADGLAAIVSGGLFLGLGYYGGRKFGDLHEIHHAIERYSLRALLVLLLVGLGVGVWVYWRKRGNPPQSGRPGADGLTGDAAANPPQPTAGTTAADLPAVTAADSPALPPA